jgi:hypothetical protein
VFGREDVPVCCGCESVSGRSAGVGATVRISELLELVFEFEFDSNPMFELLSSEFVCEATSIVGSALGSTLGSGDGDDCGAAE